MAIFSDGGGSTASGDSKGSQKAAASAIPDKFPEGMRVLVVDDDRTCLMILEKKLLHLKYNVTACNRAEVALSFLRENKKGFDVVISDVHMPDMDGFKLLEQIGLEMDLPLIMMSADDSVNLVMKGVTHGACDYLIKPVRNGALKTIWQHVVRRNVMKNGLKELEPTGSMEECLVNEENSRSPTCKRKNNQKDESQEKENNTSMSKKPRVVWNVELHQQFVAAVDQLGLNKAVPKKILEMMNVPWLTRENVASHLQKYRMYLRRLSEMPRHQDNSNRSCIRPQDASFSSISLLSRNGSTFPSATFQGAGFGRPITNPGIPMPTYPRFREGQSQQLVNMNVQHVDAHAGSSDLSSILLTQLTRQHLRGQTFNENTNNHITQLPSSIGLPISSNGTPVAVSRGNRISGNGLVQQHRYIAQLPSLTGHPLLSNGISAAVSRRNGIPGNGLVQQYSCVTQLPSPTGQPILSNGISAAVSGENAIPCKSLLQHHDHIRQLPPSNASELPGNSFPLGDVTGISGQTSKRAVQEDVNVVNNCYEVSECFTPSYDIFEDLHQHKPQDWGIQDTGLTEIESVFVSQALSSQAQMNVQISNASVQGEPMFLPGERSEQGNVDNAGQHFSSIYGENLGAKPKIPKDTQEDQASALLNQQKSISPAENEFGIDGYSSDNSFL